MESNIQVGIVMIFILDGFVEILSIFVWFFYSIFMFFSDLT